MPEQRVVSVSEAMSLARNVLETVCLRVVGEVSEVADKPGYRAAYFTLSDGEAAMPCLMWRESYAASGVTLACGMLVELSGNFSAYVPKGRLQFVARSLTSAGEGHLRLRVAELARRLEAEGLMRPERKRPLPAYPARIGVVTSPRGKAVHDVIRTLRRRYPVAEVLIAGVPVEGTNAPSMIVEGLAAAVAARCDVVLVVRGGGSYEDLMPFNHESVARAIASCPIPVVSGIGHEPDTSIADMVADLRASTPTAAAESVAPSVEEVNATLVKTGRMLDRALHHRVQLAVHRVLLLVNRPVFTDCSVLTGAMAQTLDHAQMALRRALPRRLADDCERVERLVREVGRAGSHYLERAGESVSRNAARLHDLSPLEILGRGYAVCRTADGGAVIRSAAQVDRGDRVNVLLGSGRLACLVESSESEVSDG
ncbi:MAG TPA: exodeoxyribonuclease VII large subunit [Coriobacteriia bacterium]|nr:exodeoxyribonuclease VII large subunit [Coriobacteriia bacterium]